MKLILILSASNLIRLQKAEKEWDTSYLVKSWKAQSFHELLCILEKKSVITKFKYVPAALYILCSAIIYQIFDFLLRRDEIAERYWDNFHSLSTLFSQKCKSQCYECTLYVNVQIILTSFPQILILEDSVSTFAVLQVI